ncbi:MAG: quinolinate synthase NadA [Deltaproteobacteria bacterium]
MSIVDKIQELKTKHNAVILAHNYQLPEIQDIADFVGDSLGLSMQAAKVKEEVIVFCGVHFMAQTAKIISPQKTVLLPDINAGCPMADMITAEQLIDFKKQHEGAKVICYVNTTAEVKAQCDLCCTSSNAVGIVEKMVGDNETLIFVPDENLSAFVAEKTKKNIIAWKGFCPTHANINEQDIFNAKKIYPNALVIAHPECTQAVLKLSDVVSSTEGMCRYVKNNGDEFIVATEVGILHKMKKENPTKLFYPAHANAICKNMKKITLEILLQSLEEMKYAVEVEQDIADKARVCIEKMLSVAGG